MLTERDFYAREYLRLYADSMASALGQVEFVERHCSLAPGAKVVDIGCGFGRHSLLLAARGYRVIGVDLCEPLLRAALQRSRIVPPQQRPAFVVGDMRRLPLKDRIFDAALLLFASLAQVPWEDQRMALINARRVLKPRAAVVVEVMSAKWYRRHSRPSGGWEDAATRVTDQVIRQTDDTVEIARTVSDEAGVRRYCLTQRLYTPQRIGRLLAAAGFGQIQLFGDWQHRPPTVECCYIVAVARAQ